MKLTLALFLTLVLGALCAHALGFLGGSERRMEALGTLDLAEGQAGSAHDDRDAVTQPPGGVEHESFAARIDAGDVPEPSSKSALDRAPVPVTITVISVAGVRHMSGTPLGGVEVGLFHRDSGEGALLRTSRTDADGVVTVEVPLRELGELGELKKGLTRVRASLLDPGYLPMPRTVRPERGKEDSAFTVKLRAVRGWVQPVEVIGTLDSSVRYPLQLMTMETPRVSIAGMGAPGPRFTVDGRSSVRALGDGRFEILAVESPSPRWVVVDGGSGGRATAELVPPSSVGADVARIRLELEGRGRLRGVVLDSNDDPAVPFMLHAVFQPSGGGPSFHGTEEPLRTELLKAGDGQFLASVMTGPDGSFALEGLMPGRYRLEAEVPFGRGSYGYRDSRRVELGTATASTEPERLVLRHMRPVIVVRMHLGAGGFPSSLTLFEAGNVGDPPWVKPESLGWNLPAADPVASLGAPFESAGEGVRTAHFDVEAGKQYVLVAKWPNFDSAVRVIDVPEAVPKVSVSVDVMDRPVGYLLVEATLAELDSALVDSLLPRVAGSGDEEEDGSRSHYPRSMDSPTLAVILEDPITGLPIQQKVWEGKTEGKHEFTCRAGPVRVVVLGQPQLDDHHGTVVGTRHHGRAERVIDVVAGKTSKIALEAPVGGVLRVTLTGAISGFDITRRDEEVARRRSLDHYVGDEEIDRMLRAELFLEDPARHVFEAVVREALTDLRSSAGGLHIINEWPLGETHTSTMLPSGTYTLRATFPDRAPVETRVTIREGEVTPIQLDLGH